MSAKRLVVLVAIVLCGAGVAVGQTEWVDDPGNPVIGPGDTGSWDVGGPWARAVVFDGTTYHLYFTGSEHSGFPNDMGHATSPDGDTWTMDPANPVLARGDTGSWEDTRLDGAAVVHDGTTFHMWYSGMATDYVERVGYATSPDGAVWTKYQANPVMDVGPPGSWNEHSIRPTTVMIENGAYRMWYGGGQYAGSENRFAVGFAESDDGIDWTKRPDPVLSPSTLPGAWDPGMVGNPYIVFEGSTSTYHMWYTGGIESNSVVDISIGYAWSGDGINWTKHRFNPVVTSEEARFWHSPVLHDGTSWHMWYTSTTDLITSQIEHATSTCCGGDPDLDNWLFIPAAAVASGAQGAFFQTDVDLSNADYHEVEYEFSWLPRGETNSEPVKSEVFTLGAGMSARYANVLSEVFDLEPDSLGALLIKSTSADLLAMSRTYNQPSAEQTGTFGQAMPAVPYADFFSRGERRRLVFGTENAEMRFNVGCQNASDSATIVNFELFAADGRSLGTDRMILRNFANDQLNLIFDQYRPVTGCVDFWTDTPMTQIFCYGSLLDNVTSDPTTIPPQ